MRLDDNIPIPRRSTVTRGAFARMKVGQSAFFPDEPLGSQSRPAQAAYAWGARNGRKFLARSVNGGVRIWRIA